MKIAKGLVRGKVHMNIKGFYRQTKEFKIEVTENQNYHYKRLRKIMKKK